MRVAILSDIHGNLTALEAVLEDIREMSPDLVLCGGDLADAGSSPVEVIDLIRDAGWQGVMGNTDEMLVQSEEFERIAATSSAPKVLWERLRQIRTATKTALGEERLAWLAELPHQIIYPEFALVHASPSSCWLAASRTSSDLEIEQMYSPLGRTIVIFGHTHIPFIKKMDAQPTALINTGSVGLPYDGDARASYLLLDSLNMEIRRVAYDMKKELQLLSSCHLPGADWTARILRSGTPQMP